MASNRIMPVSFPAGKQFRNFALEFVHAGIALLPDNHEIVVNTESGHYSIINWGMRSLVGDGCFNPDELCFMLILMDKWPSYVPNAKILRGVTREEPELIAQLLDSRPDKALAVLHHLAECCRQQMRLYGIEVQNVGEWGYKLSRFVAAEISSDTTAPAGQVAVARSDWPTITDEQRQRDQQLRQEHAEARRLADDAIRGGKRS